MKREVRLALALGVAVMPGCLCGVRSEKVTPLAEWPTRTLRVSVAAVLDDPTIQIEMAPQSADGDCAVLGDDARWFMGDDDDNALFEHGRVDYNGSGGGDLTPGVFIVPSCIPPNRQSPVSEALGANESIEVGFSDDSATFSATIRRPPIEPVIELVGLEPDAVVARGAELTLRSSVPLDGPDTTFTTTFSQCRIGDPSFDCSFDLVPRVEGSEILVVTVPQGAASEGGTFFVDVTEEFRAEECSADTCDVSSGFRWLGRATVVVQ